MFSCSVFITCIEKVKMKLLFFALIALAASDGPEVNCPISLSDQEFKKCVSDEINRIWKGSTENKTEFYLLLRDINRSHEKGLHKHFDNSIGTCSGKHYCSGS